MDTVSGTGPAMNVSVVYDQHWKSVPMGAIERVEKWYDPSPGSGVSMLVLATTDGGYVAFYVGNSVDIGRRWGSRAIRVWASLPRPLR